MRAKSSYLQFLAIAIFMIAVQGVATAGICGRTDQIRDYIVQDRQKPCDQITGEDLLLVTAIRVPNASITSLKPGDFDGLAHVETVNLKRNQITELPSGIFAQLADLRVLVLLGNKLGALPDDFTLGNTKLEKIHIFQNAFTTIPEQVIENLMALPKLNVLEVGNELDNATKTELRTAFPRENEVVTLIFT